jgi:hypothetical protein
MSKIAELAILAPHALAQLKTQPLMIMSLLWISPTWSPATR